MKITKRHYAPFCKARQGQLAASVKMAWKKSTQLLREKKGATDKKRATGQHSDIVRKMA